MKKRALSLFQKQRMGRGIKRVPLTDVEVLISTLISKAETRGRIGYMALNGLKTKQGTLITWGAYYGINEDLLDTRDELLRKLKLPIPARKPKE